ncbi:MAG: metallophosphoesterase [Lentisphaeria bacterium]|nr:metallophosphoesterase [Lentisphaeria bacterium]
MFVVKVISRYAAGALLSAASLLLCSCGVTDRVFEPELFETEIRSARLPEDLDGFRIAFVTDLHVDSRRHPEYLPRIVARMNELDPDLVAITGDFADGKAAELAPQFEALRGLKARYGVFGVPGNHEYYSGYRDYMAYLPTLGVTMLENSHRMIRPNFAVAGITDPAAGSQHLPMPDLAGALRGIPKPAFTVLLAHRPYFCRAASKLGVDLQLSGHTHGGLVWGLGPLIVRGNSDFVAGLYQVGPTALYVGRGAAVRCRNRWGYIWRFGVPPEITLLILRRP